jgi:hypothetical protein
MGYERAYAASIALFYREKPTLTDILATIEKSIDRL